MGDDKAAADDAGDARAPEPAVAPPIDADDPHKVEKLTRLGHDRDPDAASE